MARTGMNWSAIDDDMWLQIFTFISEPYQICQIAQVNRRFNRLCCDKRLWQRVDIFDDTNRYCNIKSLKAFLCSPYSSHTTQLTIRGVLGTASTRITRSLASKPTVNKVFLRDLGIKCGKLDSFSLINAKLDSDHFSLSFLPQNLKSLSLAGSVVSFNCLSPLTSSTCLPRLYSLNLESIHNFSSRSRQSIKGLLAKHKLIELNLGNCRKVGKADMNKIPEAMKRLKKLTVNGLKESVTDEFIINLIKNNKRLDYLDVSGCTLISDDGLILLLTSGLHLTYLDISRLRLGERTLRAIPKMPSLRRLIMDQTYISSIDNICRVLPLCKILPPTVARFEITV